MAKPKITHIQTSTKNVIGGLIPTACGLFVPREQQSSDPSCQKCPRFRNSRRRKKGEPVTKAE